ncbi:MAG: DUF4837 family protein [Crocinitomicaceae bacterium]|nr:DUF4837 family protein [Crocinitomicaceae bacterium]
MKSYTLIISVMVLFATLSCDLRSNELTIAGKIGEILVVTDKGIWESDLKECLDTNLTQWIMPYLPDVATFQLIHKTPNHFSQGVKRYRNILFINIDPDYKGKNGSIVKRDDVWARGQLVVDITAKDYAQLVKTCSSGLDNVHDAFDEIEWRRLIINFDQTKTQTIRTKIKENFGIDVVLPSNSSIVTSRDNFYRIEFPPASRPIEFAGTGTQDVGAIFSGLMIYQYDFIDSIQFSHEALLKARDTMLKYNVPHEIEGLFMGTQYEPAIYPEGNEIQNAKGTIDGYEMRGMFMFTGRPIRSTGGAFWSYHFVNPETKKLICLSGYVDAPITTSWTHPLREVQAIIRSVEFAK